MAGRAKRAWPYRRITSDMVKATAWALSPGTENERELPAVLPDWDYQMNLDLRRRIAVDLDEARDTTGLSDASDLAVSVRWNVSPSLVRGAAAWIPLSTDQHDIAVEVTIPGDRLGGILQIETMIVLASEETPRQAVAHRPGSCLWNDAVEVRLQGDAPLFPIALVPFSGSSLPDDAGWFLELGWDLDAAALGAIQLLVNQEHPTVAAAVRHAGSPGDVDSTVLSMLKTDVIRSMLERALGDETFAMSQQFDRDTLGAVLQGLMRTFLLAYAQDDLVEIRRIRENDPPLFAAIIQASTRLLAAT